ncbi:MAG: FAD-dependent oxidoreductase [Pseudomonadota bacterium]
MTSSNVRYHAAVIGAGLVGSATALALARAGLNVALVEPRVATMPSEDWDIRAYAISPDSEALLDSLGAWPGLDASRLQAVYRMDVHGDADGGLLLDAYAAGVPKLATILESSRLRHALWQAVKAHDNIDVMCPAGVTGIVWGSPRSTVVLDTGLRLDVELVVGADGANSMIRQRAGIKAKARPYGQSGVVANFATEKNHRGTAFQWFRPFRPGCGDIVAYLPLPGNRMSLVWSTAEEHAQSLLALDEQAFCSQVEQAGGSRLGKLSLLTQPAAFPLRLMQTDSPVRAGCALVGDAAHGVHPLAGQGVNLGFGDVAALAEVIALRGKSGCGDPALLERYARRRAAAVSRMQFVTDSLWRLFGSDAKLAGLARNLGMSLLNKLGPAKSALIHEAFFN